MINLFKIIYKHYLNLLFKKYIFRYIFIVIISYDLFIINLFKF